ncbi:hypothetical protein CONLIGDRAFT_685440 [Coniochaeta ligniaria NRRL 30616]|uniref:Uncharacterized protein n=1 Tax=Coniochaeta ligniaria NRRL 30616 TaxID=1408157 RepID=A0A1J7IAY0_9PEZI|nr:hypothetical protein CONLIGDRAFT_685440 [Coniochaeta ligniaria NRRL 30616]
MANGDGDQSKRPPLSQHDSDSQVSDKGQHGGQHHRQKKSAHHVGGRLHARVASSKSLHKGHGSTSSAKLTRRQASPSPDRGAFAFPPTTPLSHASGHRRATSDLNLSREASATNLLLKKNSSHTSLKRNRSKVEIIGKKSKSSTNLKSHGSTSALSNHNKHGGRAVNQVHFNLGDDEDDDVDNQEDEWVDASTSASPYLSRRTSVVSGGQNSAASSAGNSRPPTAASDQPPQQQQQQQPPPSPRPQSTRSTTNGPDSPRGVATSQHSQYLTSRILERTPAQHAPPMMSTETASVQPVSSSRAHSPDSSDNNTTMPPSPLARIRPGSSGNKPELTSRFITSATGTSGGSGSGPGTGPGSFTGALARAANGRIEVTTAPGEVRRPKSMGSLVAGRGGETEEEGGPSPRRTNGNGRVAADNDDEGVAGEKKTAAYVMNRTQQKINLQRASSSLEPSVPPHNHPALSMGGMAMASPAASHQGGVYGRGETVLPRLLERTGMEYLVVRRYQNPIARSLARLVQGREGKIRVLKRGHSAAHSRQGSELRGGGGPGPVLRELRERDGDRVGGLIGGRGGERRPGSRRGNVNGNGDGGGEGNTGLSGSSLVDGSEAADVDALLRNLWDRNMDLSAGQE